METVAAAVGDPTWYFAYGSNMNGAVFSGRRRIRPLEARRACLEDFRLSFDLPIGPGERGVANVEPDDGGRVFGVLYLLAPEDCDRLDASEGVPAGVYRRISVRVAAADGEGLVSAFTYRSFHTRAGRKPSARYMNLLLQGAREHGLPEEYIRFLEGFELARDERETEMLPERRARK